MFRPKAHTHYRARYFSIVTSNGVAKKIDEYVPAIIPTRSVSAKSRVEAGPRKKRMRSVITTVSDVLTERVKVCDRERPAVSAKSSFRPLS